MTLRGLEYVLSAVTLAVTGQVLLKIGMTRVGAIGAARMKHPLRLVVEVLRRWQVPVGLALYVISAAAWILALSTVPLSVAYPFLGLSYVAIAAVSVIALDEWLTPAQWIGITFVVAGVVTVALTATPR